MEREKNRVLLNGVEVDVLPSPKAAVFCGIAPGYMRNLRRMGKGPRYYKRGRLCLYRIEDLREWLYVQPVETIDSRRLSK